MKTIGIDLSLVGTAVCVLSGAGPEPEVRTRMIPGRKATTVAERIVRLDEVSGAIIELIKSETENGCPPVTIIEAAAKNQVWQAAAMGEMHGAVKYRFYKEFGVFPMVEEATKIRKEVIGKIERTMEKSLDKDGKEKKSVSYGRIVGKSGKLKKASIKDIIEGRLKERGLTFKTQDEMDAYVTARYAWNLVTKGMFDEGHK